MPSGHATSSPPRGPATPSSRVVQVLLPLPLAGTYDYRVPPELAVAPGDFVAVPFGNRERVGVVWGAESGTVAEEKLKDLRDVFEAPAMPAEMRAFIDWVASYTVSSPGAVLRMAMSVPEALAPPKPRRGYILPDSGGAPPDLKMTEARGRVLEVLADGTPRTLADLARAAAAGAGVVKGLAKAGALIEVALVVEDAPPRPDPERAGVDLSPDQAAAAGRLCESVAEGEFSVSLLDGVTGSGKTEVYFEAVAEALRRGRQALVLLPEIALGAQWLERFRARFGAEPAVWHSEITRARRRQTWRAVASGAARVVVGARSALYLPYRDLGLIVIDEEHDASYKQEDGVIYHARDMGVVRARLGAFAAVLVSATPSLESVVNAERGRYTRLRLPERHAGASLPDISVIDMRADPPPRGEWLSPALVTALDQALAAGEQAMLFLNRRGYAPLTLCRTCGFRLHCPDCTAWLVEHRLAGRLVCHHCGYAISIPAACPDCGTEDSLAACGPGVERLAEAAAVQWPKARIAIMASDALSGPDAAATLVRSVQAREVDLLVGTQIMAKGHHFPYLTLVGVVDADLGLAGGDLRAAERTYQLLHQVSGRAGRAERPGRALIQTYMPEHPVIQALAGGDRDRFLAAESEQRRQAGMPPFGRLAALIVSGRDAVEVEGTAAALGRAAPRGEGIEVLGPAPAPLAILRGQHRYRLLIKATREVKLQAAIRGWLRAVGWPNAVRVKVDIDPYSFL